MREYPELIKECGVTPCKLIKNDSSYVGVKSGREATGVFCLCVWAEIWLNKLLDLSCIISYRKSYHSTEEMEAVIARSVFPSLICETYQNRPMKTRTIETRDRLS